MIKMTNGDGARLTFDNLEKFKETVSLAELGFYWHKIKWLKFSDIPIFN